MTVADGLNGLRIGAVQQGVHLTTLDLTEPGDVFFLLGAPERVYMRSPREPRWADDHFFIEMSDDCWRKLECVGSGDPRQRVLVLHNTMTQE